MKRKPPKNQRAYKTPSGKKARMVRVSGEEYGRLHADRAELGTPTIWYIGDDEAAYCNADELRKWRALRNPPTSSAEQT